MSIKSPAQTVRQLIRSSQSLSRLFNEASNRSQLTERIRLCLPAELHPHCLAASVQGTTLVLYTDTPAWATSLRYQYRHLQAQLKHEHDLCHIEQIRVRVQPRSEQHPASSPAARPTNRSMPAAMPDSLTESAVDERIQTALKRLSRRQRQDD